MHRWANDPLVRAMSFTSQPIDERTHEKWFREKLLDPNARLYLAERGGMPVGLVRFQRDPGGSFELGITIAPEWRGQHLGSELLRLGCDRLRRELGPVRILARTRTLNLRFQLAAAQAGFLRRGVVKVGDQTAVELEFACDPEAASGERARESRNADRL